MRERQVDACSRLPYFGARYGHIVMSLWIDLNADLGEGCGDDAGIMQFITSCNIACGGHAGDVASMEAALRLAKQNGVRAGAHPSYPDHENFGRREMLITADALEKTLTEQLVTLKAIADDVGIELSHVKPHGALYNHAAKDEDTAHIVASVTNGTLPGAKLFGPPNSYLEKMAKDIGVAFVAEGFADRAYHQDGALRPRGLPSAVITDAEMSASRACYIARERRVPTYDGDDIPLPVQTICLHSDTPGALEAASAIRERLRAEDIVVRAPK